QDDSEEMRFHLLRLTAKVFARNDASEVPELRMLAAMGSPFDPSVIHATQVIAFIDRKRAGITDLT
ncbi:MAG: hypothetical protein H7245_09295, partial [Candidatus Saccharibacteria bacterium]|nr:hypothetical protein [Pseudorhodobacter sp.]